MPPRFLLPLLAALGLAPACAAAPGPAVVVAQLGGPTSPGFRMGVRRNAEGTPVPTPIGPNAVGSAGEVDGGGSAASQPSRGKKAGKPAGAASKAASQAASSAAKAGAGKSTEGLSDMDVLRQKLADKLGATTPGGHQYTMQVSNRGESGENVITTTHVGAAKRRQHKAAPGDANMDIAAHPGGTPLSAHWSYAGAEGPEAWGQLRPDYGLCAAGQRQSPIDIRDGIAVDLEPIQFDYHPGAFSVTDTGHTVQVDVEAGNFITVAGKRYELQQFHFHRPSEERVDGRQYDMVVHLVHKDAEGRLAVVAVLLERGGAAQSIVQAIWNNLPLEKNEAVHADTRIDLAQLLPEDRRYYTYMGSLTTPPCSEGVLWMVLKQPLTISPEQDAIFAHLYPMNARPLQQADGRLIKESN